MNLLKCLGVVFDFELVNIFLLSLSFILKP